MYKIVNYNLEKNQIVFSVYGKEKTIDYGKYSAYRKVSDNHYLDLKTDTINYMDYYDKMFVSYDIIKYKKATQYDFDRGCFKNYPNSDNGKVYNLLINKIGEKVVFYMGEDKLVIT
jgi:hypothetical protein